MRPDAAETVYSGEWLGVTRERWGRRRREIVERADVVAVVAVDCEGCVTLVRQLREAARRPLVELPAGRIEQGEEPLATARRELEEETGLRGGRWRAGPVWWSTPGFCRERVHLFFAEGLERGEPSPADDEQIELVRWPVSAAASHLEELEDAKTLAGLLLYLAWRGQSPGVTGS
jgi:ADP-ribose pyrophosphatase